MFESIVDTIRHYDRAVYRNIPTIKVSEHLLDDLSDSDAGMACGEALVAEDKDDIVSPIIMRPFQCGPSFGAAQATRFSDGTRFGVWYGSEDIETTIYETVYHLQRRYFVISAQYRPAQVKADRRVYVVRVRGILVDLVNKVQDEPRLIAASDYRFTNALGAYLHDAGISGLLFRSARHATGVNVGSFKPDILSDVKTSCYMTYQYKPGERHVCVERSGRVSRIPSFF